MTDTESLFEYRMKQAEETLQEAERMLNVEFSTRFREPSPGRPAIRLPFVRGG